MLLAVVAVVIFVGFGAAIAGVLMYGTSGPRNDWPAVGDNLPPQQTGFGMTWWKRRWIGSRNPSIPTPEEAMGPHYDIRTTDHELDEAIHHSHTHGGHHRAASWMDEPGAFEYDGLVDAPPHPHRHGATKPTHR